MKYIYIKILPEGKAQLRAFEYNNNHSVIYIIIFGVFPFKILS